ncbi:MAG TPA: hypothetical protein VEA16_08975 [Vicinamibacterales bacterium]|nr:hypothetical protein [Vicinamibacterales bacterium]
MRTWLDSLIALPFALLPKRYWQSWDLPVPNVATASAFVTLFTGFALGIAGYFAFLERLRNPRGVSVMDVADMQLTGKLPATVDVSIVPIGLAIAAPFAFALFTPLGLLATYLVLSSFARLVSAYVGEPFGDPILTGIDSAARRAFSAQRQRSARVAREQLEGANTPDLRYDGDWAGLPDVTYVIVAARRKPGWTRGTWVITENDGWFTLDEPFDRQTPNGLRTIYPLRLQTTTTGVLRKGVSYELPPLRPRAKPRRHSESQN